MKVLFASLSRIGDYIQHLSVIRAWSMENPSVDVHILVNDLIPIDLIRMNTQFNHIVLPRFEYQNRINHISTPLLYPFLSLKKLVRQLRDENYAELYDLTFQTHSLAFLKLIQPGFRYSEAEMLFINEYTSSMDQGHLIDKLKAIYDLAIVPCLAFGSRAKRVLFQVSTSDTKKNIDLQKWRVLIDKLKTDFPSIQFLVVSSKFERSKLLTLFSDNELLVCNFIELSSYLDAETRLVSLDTSIKHFAAQFQTPTLEISVGSSHWIKNAAYQAGNYIFSADYYCRPCVHSQACPLGRNECQDQIDFEELEAFIRHWVDEAEPKLFSLKTNTINGNLSIQRGEKWSRKASQTQPSL